MVEAVPERMEIKQAVFAELDAATPGHAILASNTSSLSITEIGEATLRPEKVIGFHYFYPASVMPLIEIVEGEETSAETVTAAVTFAQAIRKQPITCAEVPGFVVNRILNSATSEIWREQEEKGLSIKLIDEGVGAAGVVPSARTTSSTCSAWTPCCTWPSTSWSPTARNASTCPRACRSSSPTASSAPRRAATGSTSPRASRTSRVTASQTWPS